MTYTLDDGRNNYIEYSKMKTDVVLLKENKFYLQQI